MENHPIPQDITGFQFKLVGNMTVRQFIYLAIGVVIAAFVFFILPIPFIIRAPVALISVSIGAAFAFIPVGGRPMDTMVANFFKALFAPTQYIYQKTGGDLSQAQKNAENQVSASSVSSVQTQTPPHPVLPPPPPILSLEDEKPEQTKPQESDLSTEALVKEESTNTDIHTLLAQTQLQKEALEKEIENLKIQLNSQKQPLEAQFVPPQPAPPPSQNQPILAARQAAGLPIPESPNLITGMVNDPRGNPLQGILVEMKDEEGNPVRAFKTNGLGQFAAATSLANGKYILVFEDPKGANKFDALQIEADGNPIPPVQITSVDPREELRRQLFAAN